MAVVLGFDIGGANTKAAYVKTYLGRVEDVRVAIEYFPIWKDPEKLPNVLLSLKKRVNTLSLDAVGITMTAELSDAYRTKKEGVNKILDCVKKAFPDMSVYVLNTDLALTSVEAAKMEPLKVASANWAATGWLVGQKIKNCVVVDVGSTSTSIIPIIDGRISTVGKTDLDKLICGELVYTGSLRTNIAAIVNSIPIKNSLASVASELFALTGDVHLALGNITEDDYTCETADGRGKSKSEALCRLARLVCADSEMLCEQEIIKMAEYIYNKQIMQVAEGLNKVYSRFKSLGLPKLPVIAIGLGKDFIAKIAAEKIGAKTIDSGILFQGANALAAPAVGVAFMTAGKLEGGVVEWIL